MTSDDRSTAAAAARTMPTVAADPSAPVRGSDAKAAGTSDPPEPARAGLPEAPPDRGPEPPDRPPDPGPEPGEPPAPPAREIPSDLPLQAPGADEPLPASAASTESAADRDDASDAAGVARDDLVIAMDGVWKAFDNRSVVRDISLTVPRGTILGVIGPSGSGKTTTIRMLTGGLPPSAGKVRVLGEEPARFRRATRERIGYMPQLFTLYRDLTAGENVDFVASLFGMLWRRRRRRVREVLKLVELWDARGRQAGDLSGGMQRRLELACALVHEPPLLFLDEPTAGIDPLLRATIWEELHRLKDAGRTLLVTTQQISEAEECDAVALIVRGEIIALAPPDELRRRATHGDVIDIETAGLFDGSVLEGTEGVRAVNQLGPRNLRVTVEDAGSWMPTVVDMIRGAGVEVQSAREYRLTFDEIFAELVETWQRDHPAPTEEEAA